MSRTQREPRAGLSGGPGSGWLAILVWLELPQIEPGKTCASQAHGDGWSPVWTYFLLCRIVNALGSAHAVQPQLVQLDPALLRTLKCAVLGCRGRGRILISRFFFSFRICTSVSLPPRAFKWEVQGWAAHSSFLVTTYWAESSGRTKPASCSIPSGATFQKMTRFPFLVSLLYRDV